MFDAMDALLIPMGLFVGIFAAVKGVWWITVICFISILFLLWFFWHEYKKE